MEKREIKLEYHNGEIIQVRESDILCRNKKGEFCKIPLPPFYHGDIVTTSEKHFSQKDFTRLLNPFYSDERGWAYTENYINRQGSGGGCGMAFNADLYAPITNGADKLFAQRVNLLEKIERLQKELTTAKDELGKVEFALNIIDTDFKHKT